MHPGDATGQIEGVRRQTIAVLNELISKAGGFELADPPPVLGQHLQKLRENAYKVLVAGEAKRGKSTFVNALIGRDILPTDVDVATSQVFNVRPSPREAYRVRFEDGSAREIPPEALPLYGSQAMAGAVSLPTNDRIVRWIEVEAPIKFLPAGVSILDTPGLGALYAGHALITHRFVPEADAVIFVLESGQPVVADDLKFVEQILTVTRNIFFVQTKIDQYNKEDWQSIQWRNQEILRQTFGERLADTRVWPVSSTNLRKAATGDKKTEEAYLMVSRHKELMSALQAFLARMSGWGRTAEAIAVAAPYHATSRQVLAGRLAGLTAETKQKQAELQNAAAESKRRFDAEWGMQGQKNRELREGLQRATAVGKQSFANILQVGSDIELAQKAKIDAVKSLKQANRVAEEMPGEIITAAMNGWAEVCEEVNYRLLMLLGPFAEAAGEVGAPPDPQLLARPDDSDEKFKREYFNLMRSAAGGGMLVMGLSGMATILAPSVAVAALASPIVPFVAVPVLVALMGGGIKGALSQQVKTAQQQLRMRLAEQLQRVRRHFFDVHLTSGKFSRADEYFKTLDSAVNRHVQDLVQRKSREAQAEISRLKEAMQLDDRERAARTKRTQGQLAQWDDVGKTVAAVSAQIRALQEPAVPVAT